MEEKKEKKKDSVGKRVLRAMVHGVGQSPVRKRRKKRSRGRR